MKTLRSLAIGVLVGLTACGEAPREPVDDRQAFAGFVRGHAHTLDGSDPALGCDGFEFLGDMTDGADIVALGEARHDGREFFQMKDRLIRCLVTHHGFRNLVMEDSLPYGAAIDHYLQTGEGNLPELINGMAAWFIWDTQEFHDLLDWTRAFNAARPAGDRVRFHGMDIVDPLFGIEHMLSRLEADMGRSPLSDDQVALLREVFDAPIWSVIMERYAAMDEDRFEQVSAVIEVIGTHVDHDEAPEWTSIGRSIVQAHRMYSLARTDFVESGLYRDQAMAENLLSLAGQIDDTGRVIVWSHNLHIAKSEFDLDIPGRPQARLVPMGAHLTDVSGLSYLSVGFSFFEGVPAWGLPPSASDSLDTVLAETGIGSFLIDLRDMDDPAAAQWAHNRQIMRAQGGQVTLVPSDSFDALVFIPVIDRARPSALAQARFSTLQN